MVVIIGDQTFKTKKAAYTYVKAKIYDIGECKITEEKSASSFKFFTNLCQFKLKYKHAGRIVSEFDIYKTKQTGKSLHINVVFNNGDILPISWVDCSRQTHTTCDELNEAMRNAISYHMYEFKLSKGYGDKLIDVKCVLCNSTENIQCDHIKPFYRLKCNFLSDLKLQQPTEFDKNNFGSCVFKLKNIDFQKQWVTYHNKHSSYQLLCRTCNIKKGKKENHAEKSLKCEKTIEKKTKRKIATIKKTIAKYEQKVKDLIIELEKLESVQV